MSGKGGSSGGSTTTTTSGPPQDVLNAYNSVVGRGTTAANAPLNQYTGPLIAGFTPQQMQAFQNINGLQGAANPFINTAAQYAASSATPISPMQFSPEAVQQYQSPYTHDVVAATRANIEEANAEQQQQLKGNAISAGAWGGDRAGIAQAELARQQGLAENQTIAGLEDKGYSQALGEFNAQQQAGIGAQEATGWLGSNAGYAFGNLGNEALNTGLTAANANLQAGALQQQMAQEQLNVPYEMFLQQQAYPFQTTNFLAGVTEGTGSLSGGTSSTTAPGPSTLGQIGGLGLAGLGAVGASGGFGPNGWLTGANGIFARGGRVGRAPGGVAGFALPDIPDVSIDYVTADPAGKRGSTIPTPPKTARGSSAVDELNALRSGIDFGRLFSRQPPNDLAAPPLSPTIVEAMGERRGGRIGYADGGSMIAGFRPAPGRPGILIPQLLDDAADGDFTVPEAAVGSNIPTARQAGFSVAPLWNWSPPSSAQVAAFGNHPPLPSGATGAPGAGDPSAAAMAPNPLIGAGGNNGGTGFDSGLGGDAHPGTNPTGDFGSLGDFSASGAARGALRGMSLGSIVGLPGTVVGGLIGGALGGFSGSGTTGGGAAPSGGTSGTAGGEHAAEKASATGSDASGFGGGDHGGDSGGGDHDGGGDACFAGDTPILMADGRTKPIADIRPADMVMAFDDIGPLVPRRVTAKIEHDPRAVFAFAGVRVTGEHPFLTKTGSYCKVDTIAGAAIVDAAGQASVPDFPRKLSGRIPVFNLTVDGLHTYIAGNWRVHNSKAAGGVVRRRYDFGGPIAAAGVTGFGAPVAGGNPVVGDQYQRLAQLPIEKLQELATRTPPTSAQGALIQRALQAKKMNPAAPQPAAGAPMAGFGLPPGVAAPGAMRRGGRAGFDEGGATGSPETLGAPQVETLRGMSDQDLIGAANSPHFSSSLVQKEMDTRGIRSGFGNLVHDIGSGIRRGVGAVDSWASGLARSEMSADEAAELQRQGEMPPQDPVRHAARQAIGYFTDPVPATTTPISERRAAAPGPSLELPPSSEGGYGRAPMDVVPPSATSERAYGRAPMPVSAVAGLAAAPAATEENWGGPERDRLAGSRRAILEQAVRDADEDGRGITWGGDDHDPAMREIRQDSVAGFARPQPWQQNSPEGQRARMAQRRMAPEIAAAQEAGDPSQIRDAMLPDRTAGAQQAIAETRARDGAPPVAGFGEAPAPIPPGAGADSFSRSPWLALTAAGLRMMASRSPYAGQAFGEGGLEGVNLLQQQRKEGQLEAFQKAEIEARREGYGIAAKRLDAEIGHWGDQLKRESARDKDTADYHHGLLARENSELIPGSGQDENGNTVSGVYHHDKRSDRMWFEPGVSLTGRAGGKAPSGREWSYNAYLDAHPEEEEGVRKQHALEYAAGHRTMSDVEINKAALAAAQRDFAQSPVAPKPEVIQQRAADYAEHFRRGFAPASPAAPGAATPQPASPTIPPRPEGAPPGAQYSPSQRSWWWQQDGVWKTAPGSP